MERDELFGLVVIGILLVLAALQKYAKVLKEEEGRKRRRRAFLDTNCVPPHRVNPKERERRVIMNKLEEFLLP